MNKKGSEHIYKIVKKKGWLGDVYYTYGEVIDGAFYRYCGNSYNTVKQAENAVLKFQEEMKERQWCRDNEERILNTEYKITY